MPQRIPDKIVAKIYLICDDDFEFITGHSMLLIVEVQLILYFDLRNL